MHRFRKVVLLIIVWLLTIAILLEVGFRLAAPWLPVPLQSAAHYVLTGELRQETRIPDQAIFTTDYGITIKSGLENELIRLSPVIQAHVTTIPLQSNDTIGFRTLPPKKAVDVVFVGDSYTFCYTEYDDCWVTIFAQKTGLSVVNLGQPGTSSLSHLSILKAYGEPFAPRLVGWQFFGNDFNEDYGLAVARGDSHKLLEARSFVRTPGYHNSRITWLRRHSMAFAVMESALYGEWAYVSDYEQLFVTPYQITYRDGTLEFGSLYDERVTDITAPQNAVGISQSRKALENAKLITESWGGTLVVVIIPFPVEVYSHLTAPILGADTLQGISDAREMMLTFCGELSLLCLDVLPYFQEYARQGEHLFYTDDEHINPYGNIILARLVGEWLESQELLHP